MRAYIRSTNLLVIGFSATVIVACASPENAQSEPSPEESDLSMQMKPEDTEDWSVEPIQLFYDSANIPSDALVLVDGESLDLWRGDDGNAAQWDINGRVLRVRPGQGGIATVEEFCDIQLHIEWKSPLRGMNGDGEGQIWGNSGVFLQSRYEVQVLNYYENKTYANGQAGSIYKQHPPLVNASKSPGQWQSYDILFSAPHFDTNGDVETPARVTVLHNGVVVQNNSEIKGPTQYIGLPSYEQHGCAPLYLQDHGEAIEFRNIWVRKL